jgi:hypothetical protein
LPKGEIDEYAASLAEFLIVFIADRLCVYCERISTGAIDAPAEMDSDGAISVPLVEEAPAGVSTSRSIFATKPG